MTDYRFVSAPDVVLRDTGKHWEWDQTRNSWHVEDVLPLVRLGIIEPVPVEIPEHVVEAAYTAWFNSPGIDGSKTAIRAALIAAKQAEEAGA